MSEIRVNQIEGGDGKVFVDAGTIFDCQGNLIVPTWTNSSRPSEVGVAVFGYNTEEGTVEMLRGSSATSAVLENDGSSAEYPVASGVDLVSRYPTAQSGLFWVKSSSMSAAIQMYVDTVEDGGGYDFFATKGAGTSFNNIGNDPKINGLGLWMPRSKYAWRAASKAVASLDGGNFNSYWATNYAVYKTSGGGNYTGCIMRSSSYGGNNCGGWQTTDGGRWWIRDSTFGEPNGDYSGNTFLYMYGGQIGNPYGLNDIGFNDGTTGASTGSYYLVSTNSKA
jgi:hypothetical protein